MKIFNNLFSIGGPGNQNLLHISSKTMPLDMVRKMFIVLLAINLIIEKWALSYRHYDHKDTDTNMFVERLDTLFQIIILIYYITNLPNSFHNKLKTNPRYLNHNVNRRCDDLIEVLLLMEKDMFYDMKRMELFSTPSEISMRLDGDRHTRGQSIPDSCTRCEVYI